MLQAALLRHCKFHFAFLRMCKFEFQTGFNLINSSFPAFSNFIPRERKQIHRSMLTSLQREKQECI